MDSLPSIMLDDKFKTLLVELNTQMDIPATWQGTPIESFIFSQNLGWPIQTSGKPELLISTCIEFRYALPIPRMFAYVIRRASGRVIGSEFSVGYTMAQGVRHLVMIGHNDCGMSRLHSLAPLVVEAFVEQGWSRETAKAYVEKHAKRHGISDELEALRQEYLRLRDLFPKLMIAPLFVCLYDGKLRLPAWFNAIEEERSKQSPRTCVPDELVRELP